MDRHDKRVLLDIVVSLPLLIVHNSRQERLFDEVKIVLVGKYTDLKDSYMSVIKALEHSAFRVRRKLIIQVGSVSPESNSLLMLRSGSSHRTWSLRHRRPILLNIMMHGEQSLVLGEW
jgi:hypothetical protein